MGIEKHDYPQPAPVETGASLARLLDGLTRMVLDLPDAEPAPAPAPEAQLEPGVDETTTAPAPVVPEPRTERRGNVLNELGFLDD